MEFYPPICGSEVNPPAKLFKLFTPDAEVGIDDTVIFVQNNYYRTHFSFRWTEADDMQGGTTQPIRGMITDNSQQTIKYYGPWLSRRKESTPAVGDVVMIGDERWIIEESGPQIARKKCQVNLATIYLPLMRLL